MKQIKEPWKPTRPREPERKLNIQKPIYLSEPNGKLVDCFPDDINIDDIYFERMDYDTTYYYVDTVIDNDHFDKQMKLYEKQLAKYEVDLAKYNALKAQYDIDIAKHNKSIKDAELTKLRKRIKELES